MKKQTSKAETIKTVIEKEEPVIRSSGVYAKEDGTWNLVILLTQGEKVIHRTETNHPWKGDAINFFKIDMVNNLYKDI